MNPKGNQPWIFIGRTDGEAKTPGLWPHDVKNWLIWKDPDAAKVWKWEEKGMTADEMVGWHHWLDGHEFESAPGIGDGQGNLACCSPWGRKESDTPELLNWTELKFKFSLWGGRLESGRGCSKQRGWCVQALEARLRDQEKASVRDEAEQSATARPQGIENTVE